MSVLSHKVSVLYNTDTLQFNSTSWYQFSTSWCPFHEKKIWYFNLLMALFINFSIIQECQSCESEVLVWVSPNHSSSTRDLEKPILALPLHRIGPFQLSSVTLLISNNIHNPICEDIKVFEASAVLIRTFKFVRTLHFSWNASKNQILNWAWII